MTRRTLAPIAAAALASAAAAQFPPALPYPRTLDLLVVDTSYDGLWRLCDFDQDGAYNSPGEVVPFYTSSSGAFAWSGPQCVACGPDGTTYAADVSTDQIYALLDANGDGDANDPGEIRVFFDGANASGLPIPQVQGLTVDALGQVWVAVNNASTPAGPDRILLLRDLNGDGDAQDAGESIEFYSRPGTTGVLAASIPTRIAIGPDTSVYFTENGTTGAFAKGVWRLFDGTGNGDANDPGEATLYWAPPASGAPQYWTLAIDALGAFYLTDHSANRQVWRGRDADGSGAIDASETTLFWQGTVAASWWDVVVRDDGAVLLCDTQAPGKLTLLRDLNGDGDAMDPGEQGLAYSAAAAAVVVAPRGAAFFRAPELSMSPTSVPIGQTTTFVLRAQKPGDLGILALSFGFGPPLPLPPWGIVGIDLSAFAVVGTGFADATGFLLQPFPIPNTPTAIHTYAVQALGGDAFRWFLSNPAPLVVTP